jgi:hypothetical protein
MRFVLFRYILILLLCLPLSGLHAQTQQAYNLPVDPESKKIFYRDIVEEKGTPAYLYDKAIEWFGYYYLNAQSILSIQDKANGRIEGIGRLKIYYQDETAGVRRDAGVIHYLVKIELKGNRYRYTLTDFNLKGASRIPIEKWMDKSDPAYNPRWDSYLYQVDTTMQRLVSSLKERMKPTVIKKDEW